MWRCAQQHRKIARGRPVKRCYNKHINGFEHFTYTKHAETRLAQRSISKAELEAALDSATTIRPSRGAFVAEVAISVRDRLALKIVFSLPNSKRPHIITVHYISTKRARL